MGFKTRSYFLSPFLPNPFRSYEVDSEKNMHIRRMSGDIEKIELDGLSTRIRKGKGVKFLFNWLFGSANIELTGSSVSNFRVLENVYHAKKLKDAIDGNNLPTANAAEALPERKKYTDADLGDTVIYFPHISTTINRFLTEKFPGKIYRNQKRTGDFVYEGDVIATYGHIIVTAPFDGKIVFMGDAEPGAYEWPEDTRMTFDAALDKKRCYSFALQILEESYSSASVRYAFNNGQVFQNMKKQSGNNTLYNLLDLIEVNMNSTSAGIVPKHFKEDAEFKKQMTNCWYQINSGQGHKEKVNT